MKMIIGSATEITSKGNKYTIVRGITPDGGVVEAFMNADQAAKFGVAGLPKLSESELEAIFKEYAPVEIDFDQRGRLVSIGKVE